MLELTASVGAATWAAVWLPVAVWTIVALLCWFGLSRANSLHPEAHYGARLALLVSLPAGLLLTWLLPPVLPAGWLPSAWWASSVSAAPADAVLIIPYSDWSTVPVAEAAPEPLSLPLLSAGVLTVLATLAAIAWLLRLLRDVVAVQRLRRRLLRQSASAIQDEAQVLASSLGILRTVHVRRNDEVGVPLTCGTWQPLIVLPAGLSASEQRLSLMHELLHVRRYDYLINLVSRMVVALCAVHPLMHRLHAEACAYREIANDEAVLRQPGVAPYPYAALLLRFADAPATHYAAALSFAQPLSSLKDRISAMKTPPANRPQPVFTLLLAFLLVGAVGAFMACSDVSVDTPSELDEPALPSLEDATVLEAAETMPQPVGGMEALAENIAYTEEAKDAGIEGRVVVRFVVDSEGNVREPEVVRGLGAGLDEAAIAALEATEWKAGKQDGEPVHVRMAFPVTFRLSDAETRSSEPAASAPFDGDEVFVVVEDMPAPVGGAASIQERITYPDMAKQAGIEGRVIVQFVVDTDGTARDLQVVRGIGGGADEEALRVIQETTFTPGMQRGHTVPVRLSWPVTFQLSDGEPSAPAPPNPPAPPDDESSRPDPPNPPDEEQVFEVIENMPEPVGGMTAIQQRVQYPEMAKRAGIEGRVIVQFVVDTDGTARDAQVVRGIGGGADEEAIRVIQETEFIPGMQRGEVVPIRMSWPVTFQLPEEESNTAAAHPLQFGLENTPAKLAHSDPRLGDIAPEDIVSIDILGGRTTNPPELHIRLRHDAASSLQDGYTFTHRTPTSNRELAVTIFRD